MLRVRCIAMVALPLILLPGVAVGQVQEKSSVRSAAEIVAEGRLAYETFTPSGMARSADLARRAMEVDPKNARAWALLAESQLPGNPFEARKNAEQAVALDSGDAVTWTALARTQLATRDFAASERSFTRAIQIDPAYGFAHAFHGSLLAAQGRYEESLRAARKATALTQLADDADFYALIGLRRYDELSVLTRAGIIRDPDGTVNIYNQYFAYSLMARGQPQEALRAIARHRVLRESPPWVDAWIYARAGQVGEARRILAELVSATNPAQGQQLAAAALYAHLGEPDSSILWLEKAYPRGGMTNLKWHPQWAPVRADPRFKTILTKIGLGDTSPASDAADLVLQARVEYLKYSPAGAQRARELAQRALQREPNNAQAWAAIAEASVAYDPENAKAAAEKAVALDPVLTMAWVALARAQTVTRDMRRAEESYKRAIATDPTLASSYGNYSDLLLALGRYEESLEVARQAAARSAGWADGVLEPQFALGRLDDIITTARAALALDSVNPRMVYSQYLGLALLERGQNDEALRELARYRALRGLPSHHDAWAYARAGQEEQAQTILAGLLALPNPTVDQQIAIASLYANLGQPDNAFTWLARAEPRGGMTNLRWHPQWKPIRSDPRFEALMRKVGLE
jgi:Tfp pilus assembly protein PilF